MSNSQRLIAKSETLIRETFKKFHQKNTFRVRDIVTKSLKNKVIFRKQGVSQSNRKAALGTGWSRRSTEAKSIACVFEQHRLRLAMFVSLYPKLKARSGYNPKALETGWHFVTRALDKHRVDADMFENVNPKKYLRPIADAMRQLKKDYPKLCCVIVFELSFSLDLDGILYAEPHVHALVFGPSKDEIRKAIGHSGKGDKNQLSVVPVTNDLKKRLSYMAKFRPGYRIQVALDDGRIKRCKSKPSPKALGRWLEFMLPVRASEVLTFTGLQAGYVKRFHARKMYSLVKRIERRSIKGDFLGQGLAISSQRHGTG